jgi:hypothetical protein
MFRLFLFILIVANSLVGLSDLRDGQLALASISLVVVIVLVSILVFEIRRRRFR